MLSYNTMLERKLALSILIPLLVCITFIIFIIFCAARVEFEYAAWVRETNYLPAITEFFRTVYIGGWVIPLIYFLWCIVLLKKQKCKLGDFIILITTMIVISTVWILFAVLSFYISNQCFVALGT